MLDSNLHKRLNALGCPKTGRPDEAGRVVWDNAGDLFGDGFSIVLQWNQQGLSMGEFFRPAGQNDETPVWSFNWVKRLGDDGRAFWRMGNVEGVALASVTTLEETVVVAREAVRRIGVAGKWQPLVPSVMIEELPQPSRKGPSC